MHWRALAGAIGVAEGLLAEAAGAAVLSESQARNSSLEEAGGHGAGIDPMVVNYARVLVSGGRTSAGSALHRGSAGGAGSTVLHYFRPSVHGGLREALGQFLAGACQMTVSECAVSHGAQAATSTPLYADVPATPHRKSASPPLDGAKRARGRAAGEQRAARAISAFSEWLAYVSEQISAQAVSMPPYALARAVYGVARAAHLARGLGIYVTPDCRPALVGSPQAPFLPPPAFGGAQAPEDPAPIRRADGSLALEPDEDVLLREALQRNTAGASAVRRTLADGHVDERLLAALVLGVDELTPSGLDALAWALGYVGLEGKAAQKVDRALLEALSNAVLGKRRLLSPYRAASLIGGLWRAGADGPVIAALLAVASKTSPALCDDNRGRAGECDSMERRALLCAVASRVALSASLSLFGSNRAV